MMWLRFVMEAVLNSMQVSSLIGRQDGHLGRKSTIAAARFPWRTLVDCQLMPVNLENGH